MAAVGTTIAACKEMELIRFLMKFGGFVLAG